ncbi:hypothetical protein EDC04DRAFT_2612166 [Pisolithus marmoratus]|nr:hypothetical protein EDC04DRAFT_2612166 [Pisolithus marmoratus]
MATTLAMLERREYSAYQELLKIVPNLEEHVMTSSEEAVITIAELIQKGASGARADNTKSMKAAIIDWITLKGQTLIPHIPRNVKTGQGFHHKRTGTLLCPTGYEWEKAETKVKLHSGQLQVAGDQWPLFLYVDYSYDMDDPWNGLLCSGLLVLAYRHVFTLPSSVDQEPKAMQSGNACIQCWLLMLPLSILELLEDPDETDEVDQLMGWWNWYAVMNTPCMMLMSQQTDLPSIY